MACVKIIELKDIKDQIRCAETNVVAASLEISCILGFSLWFQSILKYFFFMIEEVVQKLKPFDFKCIQIKPDCL